MRGAVAQSLLFVNEVHLALLDGAPSARLPESEAGVESEVGVESEAGVETERPLTVRDLARKAAQRNSWSVVQKYK